jgi:hypothetical protein
MIQVSRIKKDGTLKCIDSNKVGQIKEMKDRILETNET